MSKLIVINGLTLSRMPLSLMFCLVVLYRVNPFLPCAVLFALVAITDFLDGKLARKYNIQSDVGAVLDVMSDFFFIVSASLALCFQGLFPGWMLAVIILKFLEFLISSALLKRNNKYKARFLFDSLGQIVAVLFYLLPVLILLLKAWVPVPFLQIIIWIICVGITVLATLSSLLRVLSKVNFIEK